MPFKIHNLTKSAIDWARTEIGYYPGRLREHLLSRDWSRARLFAWLPADLPADLKVPFDASFVTRLGRDHAMDWEYTAAEIGYIQAHLLTTDGGVFLYQADYFRLESGLPVRRAPGEQLIVFDQEQQFTHAKPQDLWIYLDKEFEESELVKLAYHRGKWPEHGLGILTSRSDTTALASDKPAGLDVLHELSANIRAVLLPAWRGDSFIFVEWP